MSETMVAKVAQAMWAQKEELTPPPRVSWENAPPDEREFMFKIARAAIAAMREPTRDMEFDGAHVLPDYDPGCEDAKACWQAMIAAALKE